MIKQFDTVATSFILTFFTFGSKRLNGSVGNTCQQQEPWKYRSYFSFSLQLRTIQLRAKLLSLSLSLPHAGNREVHSTTRTTCPHSSGLEMSFAALTAILTASRKRGIATILRQTDDNGQTTCQINKTRIYTFCQHNIPPTKNVQTIINNSSSNILFVFCDKRNLVLHV